MTHPLEDSYDKLDRADEHLESIKGEIQRFLETNPYSVVTNNYPGSMNKIHVIATAKIREDTPRRLRVLIGEFFSEIQRARKESELNSSGSHTLLPDDWPVGF